jgi:hypothetical protein
MRRRLIISLHPSQVDCWEPSGARWRRAKSRQTENCRERFAEKSKKRKMACLSSDAFTSSTD